MAASTSIGSSKQVSSLNLASGSALGTKRKVDETDVGKSWDEVIKRSKLEKETKEANAKAEKKKGEKAKKKEKKKQEKKVGLLSFDDG
jgi:nucleosome binding factor SPN SPT16 subunit